MNEYIYIYKVHFLKKFHQARKLGGIFFVTLYLAGAGGSGQEGGGREEGDWSTEEGNTRHA